MVRIRKQNGDAVKVDGQEAVEIIDNDGFLSVLVLQDHKGTTRILIPGDPLFNAFCRTHGMSPANVHTHVMPAMKPVPL